MESYVFDSPIGRLKICGDQGKITGLSVTQEETGTVLLQRNECHSDVLYEAYCQLREYFSGSRRVFELPVSCSGTNFQQRVWKELQKIPYGETRSYEDIAIGIGNPKAVRAVGQANNKNPVLIIVPCHRVILKSGMLGGFGCGIEAKAYLLELEKQMMTAAQSGITAGSAAFG